MKKACIATMLLVTIASLSNSLILRAQTTGEAMILPNHTGYLDLTTIPITYHIVGEVCNAGTASLRLVNVTAIFYAQNNSIIGSNFSYALLDVVLPDRKAPFEIIFVGTLAKEIYNYTLTITFREFSGEKLLALQMLENSVHTDEAGFLKVRGIVKNLGISNATVVKVVASFYDARGMVLGIARGYTLPSTVMPNIAEGFEIELARKIGSYADYSLTVESVEYEAIGTQLTINYGATYTISSTVTLIQISSNFRSTIAQMRFSQDNITFTGWEPYATSRLWNLEGADGLKTVYAQFMDTNGSSSPTFYDTIILDTTAPEISILSPVNGSRIESSSLEVKWAGLDATSGIMEYETKLDNTSWTSVDMSLIKVFNDLTIGEHKVSIRATDKAGFSKQKTTIFFVERSGLPLLEPRNIVIAAAVLILALGATIYFLKTRKHKRHYQSQLRHWKKISETISNRQINFMLEQC